MASLPIPGGDDGVWGDKLNTFLLVEHNADGSLKRSADIANAVTIANGAQQDADAAQATAANAQSTVGGLQSGVDANTALISASLGVVVYSAGWSARPNGYGQVLWIGPGNTPPTSTMQPNDLFIANA